MNPALLKLIRAYQSRVADAVALLEEAGIERPTSATAWASSDMPGRGSLQGGFTYYAHGFGCVVAGAEWGVDFDFGEAGEIDGFDASRLFSFARRKLAEYGFESEQAIQAAVRCAEEAGALKFSGYILYYLNDSEADGRSGTG